MSLINKIKSLNQDKDSIIGRVARELINLITPQLDTLLSSQQDALNALNKTVHSDLGGAKMHAYIFSALINILEKLKKGWDDHLQSLKIIFTNIFNFL